VCSEDSLRPFHTVRTSSQNSVVYTHIAQRAGYNVLVLLFVCISMAQFSGLPSTFDKISAAAN